MFTFYGTLDIPFGKVRVHSSGDFIPDLLMFGDGNAKIDEYISTFSLPSGYTCPGANQCKTMADKNTGKLRECAGCVFRCFSASQESLYPVVRRSRWGNFFRLNKCKTKWEMARLILESLPQSKFLPAVRIHVSGDFFSQMYFDAWMEVARRRPSVIFYAYTKSIPFWIKRLGSIPKNMKLTASLGGKFDDLIVKHKLKYCKVVFSVQEARNLRLEIDQDDSHAYESNKSFCVLLHGKQSAGSPAGLALIELSQKGIGGYGVQREKRLTAVA